MSQHNRQIDAARRVLQPSPVDLHRVPNWLRLKLLKLVGSLKPDCGGHGLTDGWSVLQQLRKRYRCLWLDHCGKTRLDDGRVAFVSEPYGLTPESLVEAEKLATTLDVDFWLTPNSWWYPGNTWRLVFAEKVAK